ncbi:hypothetical protein [Streptomyces silvisoli]|uniref:Transcriptional regulator n=1 Tax=Streptomyces silvisoli TaxID=3034235 RepID=A0ABT5ZWF6_9ACTN|nr:hypothetical protein [Streptomyces silvisoli]MDF3293935.1 hypothetical protein [Streptomyces silvisoli]
MSGASTLASCLERLSWSPDRLAREVNKTCGENTISIKAPYNWLKGSLPRHGLPQVVAEILSQRLGEPISVRDLWPDKFGHEKPEKFSPSTQSSSVTELVPPSAQEMVNAAVDWLVGDDPPLDGQLRGEEITPQILTVLDARTTQLRQLDDEQSGRVVLDWAVQELRWARKLAADGSYDREMGRRLHQAIAQLAQLAGWIAADIGRHDHGRRYLLGALRSARTSGDRALAAHVISCLSYHSTWVGQGREALRLAQIARKGVEGTAASRGQALLASRQARAYAVLGDVEGCLAALGEGEQLMESGGAADGPSWSYWITPAVLVADAGRALLDLGRIDQAERQLICGIELFGNTQPRNRLLHWTSLAEARLARGAIDEAAAAAAEALGLYEQVTSQRARARLAALQYRFADCDTLVARQMSQRITLLLKEARPLASCT